MDRGEFFKHEFEVLPADNGSFIVTLGTEYDRLVNNRQDNISVRGGRQPRRWAFSNVQDLLYFFTSQVAVDDSECDGSEQ
jgi:hypothetical protein